MAQRGKAPKGKGAKFYRFGRVYEVEGNIFHRVVNTGYNLFMIVTDFSKKLLWFGSCAAFMFLLPMGFEIFCEQ